MFILVWGFFVVVDLFWVLWYVVLGVFAWFLVGFFVCFFLIPVNIKYTLFRRQSSLYNTTRMFMEANGRHTVSSIYSMVQKLFKRNMSISFLYTLNIVNTSKSSKVSA